MNDMPAAPLPRRKPGLAVLVAISALQPFALNSIAPATPAMARSLGASYSAVQLTLSLYLITVAVSQLVIGPLSDRFGRRPCVLISIVLFIGGSIIGVLSPDLPTLLVARVFQAAGAGTAFALARAIIRDTANRDETASQIGYVTMVMVTVPMVSPLFGAWLDSYAGWRAIFAAMALMGFMSLAMSLWRLSETAPFSLKPGSIASTFQAIPLLIGNREFQGHAIALTATSASFFAFIAAAPFLVVEVMKQSPQNYGLWFMVNALGYMVGNYFTGRFSQKLGSERLTMIGLKISCVGLTLGAIAPFSPFWSPATFFLPLMVSAVGNGLSIPSSTAGGLSVQPELAGAAAGLIGAIQLGLGAIAAIVIGWMVTIWPPALTTAMWAFTGGALLWLSLNSNRRNY